MPKFKTTAEALKIVSNQDQIRNLGIIAHVDHGKTTTSDSLLAATGMLSPSVAGQALALDYMELEQSRQMTIKAANVTLYYEPEGKPYVINLIDTPGHMFAQTVSVPFVGCKSDGQTGPLEAPKGTDRVVPIKASAARKLAFYQASAGLGVLAPRGWYCFGTYGSSSFQLSVFPQLKNSVVAGPFIELESISAEGSGRYQVAPVIARIFPAHRAFIQKAIDAGIESASDYTFGPYPNDEMILQTDHLVRYRTPPRSEGLGTMGQREPNDDPIDGTAILDPRTFDLQMLRVRLPPEQRDLAPVIIQDLLIRQRNNTR